MSGSQCCGLHYSELKRPVCWDTQLVLATMQPVVCSGETLNGGAQNQQCCMHHVLVRCLDPASLCELLSVHDSNTIRYFQQSELM